MLNFKNIKCVQSRPTAGNKSYYIFLFIILFCCEAKTQTNLIYNGDFEIYDTCPTNFSSPFDYQIRHCLGWDTPTYATSDYFNMCSTSFATIPLNVDGYQYPKSGTGYCGLIAYSYSNGGCYSGSYWWEYIQGRFISPLSGGRIYRIGMYVSLGDYSNIAVKNIGFYISQSSSITNSFSPAPIYATPQILNGNGLLTDTLNWVLISGEYTAVGGESFITIGHFADSLTTDTVTVFPSTLPPFSYYFIDGTFVYDVTDSLYNNCHESIPNVFTPNGDGVNEVFKYSVCSKILNVEIYNRWGVKVFDADSNSYFWDGKTNSDKVCSDGIYYYILETKEKRYQGFIQLIR